MIPHKLNLWPLLPVVILLVALVASRLIGGGAVGNQPQVGTLPDETSCSCCIESE